MESDWAVLEFCERRSFLCLRRPANDTVLIQELDLNDSFASVHKRFLSARSDRCVEPDKRRVHTRSYVRLEVTLVVGEIQAGGGAG